jgi:hypothetical protein
MLCPDNSSSGRILHISTSASRHTRFKAKRKLHIRGKFMLEILGMLDSAEQEHF